MSAPVARSLPRRTTPDAPDAIDAIAAPRSSSLAWGSAYMARSPATGVGGVLGGAAVARRLGTIEEGTGLDGDAGADETAFDPHAETTSATRTSARADRLSCMTNPVAEHDGSILPRSVIGSAAVAEGAGGGSVHSRRVRAADVTANRTSVGTPTGSLRGYEWSSGMCQEIGVGSASSSSSSLSRSASRSACQSSSGLSSDITAKPAPTRTPSITSSGASAA
jgi:hypothetical protein